MYKKQKTDCIGHERSSLGFKKSESFNRPLCLAKKYAIYGESSFADIICT